MNCLFEIQQRLKAPKGQFNKFGGFNYRSAEDILEAVKPLLNECSLVMTISDDILNLGNRFYIKSTVTLFDKDGKVVASTTGVARESETKKGMDESQITGATSSYARKYALNGLFAIDDTKDADSNEYQNQTKPQLDAYIVELVNGCKTKEELKPIYEQLKQQLTGGAKTEFLDLVRKKKEELENANS